MPFDYYEHLSLKQKATYRKSDAVPRIEVPDPLSLAPRLEAIRTALEADDRTALGRATRALATEILTRLKVPPLTVRVLARRPSTEGSELHGLYVREAEPPAVISLWMRTAAHVRPVKYRTFVRTLAHELLHHLDFELLELEDTFHTEGFFRRESDLARQLLGEPRRAAPVRSPTDETPQKRARRTRVSPQLSLFEEPKPK